MNKQIGTRYKERDNNVLMCVGTTDKNNTDTFYVDLSFFIESMSNFFNDIDIEKKLHKNINNICKDICRNNSLLTKNFICDIDLSTESLLMKNKSHFNSSIYFSLQPNGINKFNDLKENVISPIAKLVKDSVIDEISANNLAITKK